MMDTVSVARIEWIVIPAPAIKTAQTFYQEVFGFKITPFRERFVLFEAGNLHGALDQDLVPSISSLSFSLTVPCIEETLKRIADHGGRTLKEPYELGPGAGLCAQFADPNGNELELYQPRSESNEPEHSE